MSEEKKNPLVTLVKRAVGLPRGTSGCCGATAPASGGDTAESCCGSPAPDPGAETVNARGTLDSSQSETGEGSCCG